MVDKSYPIKPIFGKPYVTPMLTCGYVFIPTIEYDTVVRPNIKKMLRTNFILFP